MPPSYRSATSPSSSLSVRFRNLPAGFRPAATAWRVAQVRASTSDEPKSCFARGYFSRGHPPSPAPRSRPLRGVRSRPPLASLSLKPGRGIILSADGASADPPGAQCSRRGECSRHAKSKKMNCTGGKEGGCVLAGGRRGGAYYSPAVRGAATRVSGSANRLTCGLLAPSGDWRCPGPRRPDGLPAHKLPVLAHSSLRSPGVATWECIATRGPSARETPLESAFSRC